MSHIAFDLDALPLVPKVARSAGIQEAVVGWGLTQMWEWCWRVKTDQVTTNHLRGFFGAELGAVLVDFGFLEPIGSNLWRVRGAARYLRIQAGREKGGLASKSNLKQYQKAPAEPPAAAPAAHRLPTGSPPADVRLTDRLNTGLSATSDERLATSDKREEEGTPAAPASPLTHPDPRQLQAAWNETAHEALPRCQELGDRRRRTAAARLRERPIDGWRLVVERINASRFCRGENDRGWVANFDWLIRPDTATKVLEGQYDDRTGAAPSREQQRVYTEGSVSL